MKTRPTEQDAKPTEPSAPVEPFKMRGFVNSKKEAAIAATTLVAGTATTKDDSIKCVDTNAKVVEDLGKKEVMSTTTQVKKQRKESAVIETKTDHPPRKNSTTKAPPRKDSGVIYVKKTDVEAAAAAKTVPVEAKAEKPTKTEEKKPKKIEDTAAVTDGWNLVSVSC